MGNTYTTNAAVFLIDTLFSFFLIAVMLRLLFQIIRADFYNPISQFLVKVTNPGIKPLRRIIPGIGGIDLASVVLLLLLQMLASFLIGWMVGANISIAALLVYSIADLISLLLNIYLIAIFIQVILSWVAAGTYNPVISLLYSLNEPILSRARRILPPISGLDLSPIIVILAIQLIKILVVAPIADMGRML